MLGYTGDSRVLGPLKIDPVDVALGFASTAHIEADGALSYERSTVDPRTGRREVQRAIAGRLALALFFAPGTKLQTIDAQHSAAPLGIAPHIGHSGDGNFAALTPFAREGSGIDIDAGLSVCKKRILTM